MILQGQKELRGTTLLTAWNWGFLAAICWSVTWFADQFGRLLSPELADHMWYASAVLVLCPPIAVLGSRRPGTRVWTCFILLPMLFALGWPVVAALFHVAFDGAVIAAQPREKACQRWRGLIIIGEGEVEQFIDRVSRLWPRHL